MTTTKEDRIREEFCLWFDKASPDEFTKLGAWQACAESYEKTLAEKDVALYGLQLAMQRVVDGITSEAINTKVKDGAYQLAMRDTAARIERLLPIRPVEQLQLLTEAHKENTRLKEQLSEANQRNAMLVEAINNISFEIDYLSSGVAEKLQRAISVNSEAVAAWEAEKLANIKPDVPAMVTRFLSWRLPKDFNPDCGITFNQVVNDWPIGTNLLTGPQATDMIHHILGRISDQDIDEMSEKLRVAFPPRKKG